MFENEDPDTDGLIEDNHPCRELNQRLITLTMAGLHASRDIAGTQAMMLAAMELLYQLWHEETLERQGKRPDEDCDSSCMALASENLAFNAGRAVLQGLLKPGIAMNTALALTMGCALGTETELDELAQELASRASHFHYEAHREQYERWLRAELKAQGANLSEQDAQAAIEALLKDLQD
jgi:hypothetical protein